MLVSRYASHLALACCAAWLLSGTTADARLDCTLTATGVVPLSDLAGTYRGVEGGLYPGGVTVRPPDHEAVGLDLALNQVRPLNPHWAPDAANGRIGLVSLGMSNTSIEFGSFLDLVRADPGPQSATDRRERRALQPDGGPVARSRIGRLAVDVRPTGAEQCLARAGAGGLGQGRPGRLWHEHVGPPRQLPGVPPGPPGRPRDHQPEPQGSTFRTSASPTSPAAFGRT
jgi:hypothetical protein